MADNRGEIGGLKNNGHRPLEKSENRLWKAPYPWQQKFSSVMVKSVILPRWKRPRNLPTHPRTSIGRFPWQLEYGSGPLFKISVVPILMLFFTLKVDIFSNKICQYCMYVCMPFYVVHYHNNLMKAHHYHKSHQIPSDSLEKMNIIILMFKWKTNKSMQ